MSPSVGLARLQSTGIRYNRVFNNRVWDWTRKAARLAHRCHWEDAVHHRWHRRTPHGRRFHSPGRSRQCFCHPDPVKHDLVNVGNERLRAVAFFAAAVFPKISITWWCRRGATSSAHAIERVNSLSALVRRFVPVTFVLALFCIVVTRTTYGRYEDHTSTRSILFVVPKVKGLISLASFSALTDCKWSCSGQVLVTTFGYALLPRMFWFIFRSRASPHLQALCRYRFYELHLPRLRHE